ncbi:MAG: HAMP domain-containing protein [Thermoleophilaceae bacterium]|nr:HAMP domain-containing protein [Thermoleophilaceae bacterium]
MLQLVTPSGEPRTAPFSNGELPVTEQVQDIAASGEGQAYFDQTVDGEHLRVLVQGVGPRGAIEVARPLDEVDRSLDRALATLTIVGLLGIALAVGLGLLVARTALAPIAAFTRRTEELAAAPDLSGRLDVEGGDELARLAESFNLTLAALERSLESQRHLVADASHELRTPIASLRANIQILEDADRLPPEELAGLRSDIILELDELTALVADVVELARGAKTDDDEDDVRLDRIAADLVERDRRRWPGLVYQTRLERTVVTGQPERVQRAVSNLLDNARKWSPDGGTVEVVLAGGELTVRDHGPGFAREDIEHVFDRFYRAESARGMQGSGLGLAIVRQSVESHGGWVRAENASDGGAVVTACFGAHTGPLETPA